MWIITILSILGVILNVKRRKECFIVWAFTNFAWMVYDFRIQAYAQSALFAVYFILAIWGLYEWRKNDKTL